MHPNDTPARFFAQWNPIFGFFICIFHDIKSTMHIVAQNWQKNCREITNVHRNCKCDERGSIYRYIYTCERANDIGMNFCYTKNPYVWQSNYIKWLFGCVQHGIFICFRFVCYIFSRERKNIERATESTPQNEHQCVNECERKWEREKKTLLTTCTRVNKL